ncbi:MAG: baseplate J/gp47 family protein [Candidatus Dormibacteria bacterium]
MQYSNSLGKRTSVVSPDQRTQATALETGFGVFPSIAAFESGQPIDQLLPGGGGTQGLREVPAAAAAAVVDRPRRTPPPARDAPPRPVASARFASPGAGLTRKGPGAVPYLLAAIGIVLVLLIVGLIVLPSATIIIISNSRTIDDKPTLNGSPAASAAAGGLTVQTFQHTGEKSQSQQFPTTGTKVIAAAPAQGSVVFHNGGGLCGPTIADSVAFPASTEVYTDDGVKFITTQSSGDIKAGNDSSPVPIVGRSAGANTNVSAGAIKHITNGEGCNFAVNNPQATSGGTDASTKQVVSQADLDKAKAQLVGQLVPQVTDDIEGQAKGQKVLKETEFFSVIDTYDKKVNDEAQNFTANITIKGRVTAVDDARVRSVLLADLKRHVPADYMLTADPPTISYKPARDDGNGNLVFDCSVSGFMAQALNFDSLRSQVTGRSPGKARATIKSRVDSIDVVIQQTPLLPWMPFIGSRIDIREQTEKPSSG